MVSAWRVKTCVTRKLRHGTRNAEAGKGTRQLIRMKLLLCALMVLFGIESLPALAETNIGTVPVFNKDFGTLGSVCVTCTEEPLAFKKETPYNVTPTSQYRYDAVLTSKKGSTALWSRSSFYDYDPPSATGPVVIYDVLLEDDIAVILGGYSEGFGNNERTRVVYITRFKPHTSTPGTEISFKHFASDTTMFPPVSITGGHLVGSYKLKSLRAILDNFDSTLVYKYDGKDWVKLDKKQPVGVDDYSVRP